MLFLPKTGKSSFPGIFSPLNFTDTKALEAEMMEHLGYEKNSNTGDNNGNSRNGHTEKTVLLENQSTTIEVPRDRNSTFEPIIVPQHEKRISLFNDQIISMYSFGMSDKQIREHLEKVYNIDVSPDLISRVTNEVLDEVKEWQNRPLEKSYAIIYLDALWTLPQEVHTVKRLLLNDTH